MRALGGRGRPSLWPPFVLAVRPSHSLNNLTRHELKYGIFVFSCIGEPAGLELQCGRIISKDREDAVADA